MSLGADGVVCRLGEPLSAHTAWRTGGACEAWVVVHRPAALLSVLADCRRRGWQVTPLGAGSRVVVRDGGLAGAVLRLGTGFARVGGDGGTLEVGAAVPVPALLARCARLGLTGLEHLARVPGSVGASLALDPWPEDGVVGVSFVHRGEVRQGTIRQARGRLITAVRLRLARDEPAAVATRTRSSLRCSREPLPSSWYAGRGVRSTLERAQLLQVRLRQVAIPRGSPELLVNLGEGTAADLALLHRSALERVKRCRGALLRSRVMWVGTHRRVT